MSSPKHILVVEDERHLAVGIKFNLEAEGYRVTAVGDGPAALRELEETDDEIDLVILDIMLPGMSGYTVCEALRERGNDVPILILSARTLSEDRTRGFNVGANQYLSKPFDLDELLSRVNNLLTHYTRRHQSPRPAPTKLAAYEFGTAKIDFSQYALTVAGKPVQLTKREWELLAFFVENEGRLVTRQEILEQVWQMPGHINTRAPDQFIVRLRKIFEEDPTNPRHFLTIRDLGYRFISRPDEPEAA
ncbi:MAG: response regulator transcription factor [Planctomycetaceae bacterium]|nr:response regulator transcription factor [Planctomycetaceae bacterium]